jgi:hypothetical protein
LFGRVHDVESSKPSPRSGVAGEPRVLLSAFSALIVLTDGISAPIGVNEV